MATESLTVVLMQATTMERDLRQPRVAWKEDIAETRSLGKQNMAHLLANKFLNLEESLLIKQAHAQSRYKM